MIDSQIALKATITNYLRNFRGTFNSTEDLSSLYLE